jgi:hypothetical protein
MGAGRARHGHLKRAKPKQRRLRPKKSFNLLKLKTTTDSDENNQVETAHSLLRASLRFWEIERDLIEERIAALGR